MDPNYGQALVEQIQREIRGRIAHEQHNCNYLAWAIAQAGDGDHLEIGTLFGGTAILAALIKQELGYQGDIWCVDPLDGYYVGTPYEYPVDPVSGVPINEETVWANARAFGVEERLHIIARPSQPWPPELRARTFASAFIDGDHWGEMPWRDWECVYPRTTRYVIFDNYDDRHPAVQQTCRAAERNVCWQREFAGGITFIVRRVREC